MVSATHILGVILAGGRSRRFGGGDKGFADLGGRPVLAHVITRFRPQVGHLLINANGDPNRFAHFGLDIVTDGENPELGPLSGVLAAIDWAMRPSQNYTAIATVSTDVPFLPNNLIVHLDAERGDGVTIAASAGRRHPTIAIWPASARAAVAEALSRRTLSVDALAAKLGAVAVDFPMRDIGGAAVDPFFNVNTPDDLENARTLLSNT